MPFRSRRSMLPAVLAMLATAIALAPGAAAADASAVPSTTSRPAIAVTGSAQALHGSHTRGARFGARLVACQRSAVLDGRTATVLATMRPVPGATQFALRIDLLQRPLAGGRWTVRSDVPGLGSWMSPKNPALGSRAGDVFKYRQSVQQLVAPFAYRFKVRFRWSDADDKVVKKASALSKRCAQPDLRPDLVLPTVTTLPAPHQPKALRYTVTVRNTGHGPARGIVVAANFPGNDTASGITRTIFRLDAGRSAQVSFGGPPCSSLTGPPSFTVDPSNVIDELNEANNQLTFACPAS